MNGSDFLKVAKQAAKEAGEIISKYSKDQLTLFTKKDISDFATQADLEAEQKIVGILQKNFPGHNIIGEEQTKLDKNSEYTWVIDPLDGTVSFVAGIPTYSVSIGLLKDKKPILGVVNYVPINEMYWAEEGKGAFLNGLKITVSKVDTLENAVLNIDCGHMRNRQAKYDRYLSPLMNKVRYTYSLGGAVAAMVLVAKGTLDAAPNSAFIWDFAAATVIVKEAGGKVTDLEGNEPDWTKERLDIAASNGLIHGLILQSLK